MMQNAKRKLAALLCCAALAAGTAPGVMSAQAAGGVTLKTAQGAAESAFCEWEPVSGAEGYHVYADGKPLDSLLIRQYSGYYRADAVGLKAGSHTLKVVPLRNGQEDISAAAEQTVAVTAHDRSGFGFVNGSASGAYNDDGTLKSGAVVLYVTDETKDTVKLDVITDSKGTKTAVTGIQNILTAYQKGTDSRPLDIRCIGNLTDPAVLMDGDLLLKGSGASKRLSCGVTVEGIGNDTVFNGFGLRIANCSGVEVRNIGFMNCNSGEGDDIGLQQNNDHVWVHNCDLFYGDAGSDADQAKGDGALDTKTSTYITHSYNHFWDSGKCNLQGMKSESTENCITYHHNWYDHSDSRHPRIRTCTVHIYNNYYDGNAKYGVGVTMGASAFVEQNYFRNCPKPMLSSMQGTDAQGEGTFSGETGGIIKAYNNIMTDAKSYITYQKDPSGFDAYEVTNAKDTVPASVRTLSGGTSYNNFDTAGSMYAYRADKPEDVPAVVTANAGRLQGGDFKWTFNNASDDASYAVNTGLKSALVNYKSSVVKIGSGAYVPVPEQPAVTDIPAATTASAVTAVTVPSLDVSPGSYIHNFTKNGLESSFYTITGNLSTSKGTVSYAGETLTRCLKMESATSIVFTAPADGTLTLVFIEPAGSMKLDGQKYAADGSGILTIPVSAGSHTVTKADSCNLFRMEYAAAAAPAATTAPGTAAVPETTAAETVQNVKGDISCNGKTDVSDAVMLARFIAEDTGVTVTEQGLANADCDGVKGISPDDLTMLLRIIAKLVI